MTTARVTWEEPGGHIEKASHFFGTTESNDMGNVKNGNSDLLEIKELD